MNSLDDLKTIWQTAGTAQLPDAAEYVQLVKKFRRKKLRSKMRIIVFAILAMALMIVVMAGYKSALLTTRIGEVFIMVACALMAASNIRSISRFRHLQDDCTNKELLSFIEVTRQNQQYFYSYTQVFIIAVWAFGFLLYIYEIVYKHTALMIGAYSLCLLYILLLFFVIRPYSFRREAKKLQATRERLERILNQLP